MTFIYFINKVIQNVMRQDEKRNFKVHLHQLRGFPVAGKNTSLNHQFCHIVCFKRTLNKDGSKLTF